MPPSTSKTNQVEPTEQTWLCWLCGGPAASGPAVEKPLHQSVPFELVGTVAFHLAQHGFLELSPESRRISSLCAHSAINPVPPVPRQFHRATSGGTAEP